MTDASLMDPTPGLTVGADGRARCAWAGSAPEYLSYHLSLYTSDAADE
jgi:hypothetical protein